MQNECQWKDGRDRRNCKFTYDFSSSVNYDIKLQI